MINPETLVENGAKGGSFALGSMPMREGMKQPAMNAVFPELLKVCLDFSISRFLDFLILDFLILDS